MKQITKETVDQALKKVYIKTNNYTEQAMLFLFFKGMGVEVDTFERDIRDMSYDDNCKYYLTNGDNMFAESIPNPDRKIISVKDLANHLLSFEPDVIVELNDEYSAKVDKENKVVKVGCQDIPFSKVVELYEALDD